MKILVLVLVNQKCKKIIYYYIHYNYQLSHVLFINVIIELSLPFLSLSLSLLSLIFYYWLKVLQK